MVNKNFNPCQGKPWENESANFLGTIIVLFFCLLSSCVPEPKIDSTGVHPLQGVGHGINNSILVVDNLDSTLTYFSDMLGFSKPMPGGFSQGSIAGSAGTRILLPDMSAIEIIGLGDSTMAGDESNLPREDSGPSQYDHRYSISSSQTDQTYSWLRSQGFQLDSAQSFSATMDEPTEWEKGMNFFSEGRLLDAAHENEYAYLPQFVEYPNFDYQRLQTDWKTFLSFGRSFQQQPNGVVGTKALQIVVDDLEAARKEYLQMGLVEEGSSSDTIARFRLTPKQELHLISPLSPDDELSNFLHKHGSGVYGITFEVKDLTATHDFLAERLPAEALAIDSMTDRLIVGSEFAYGLQMEFQQEPEAQSLLAQQLQMGPKLDSAARANAAGMYTKYCALCHGDNREGYAADFAPSLRSHSLMATSRTSNFLRYTIQYGRSGTAMAGYSSAQGGPLEYIEIELLLQWLYEESGAGEPIELPREPVRGDVELGASIYTKHCTACHGKEGEGISAPALGNPMLLATATDEFLRYAISEGRDSTLMPAFKDSLRETEIDALTAFLRSRASGWDVPQGDSIKIPLPENYVLNPNGTSPTFTLRQNRFVSAKQVHQALEDGARFVLLDARSTVAWRQTHIPGAIPVPYYEEPEAFIEHIPNDSTWIVAYCACPHAASGQVINTLNRYGYKNTAILDEGILVWAQDGYPVEHGN